MSWLKSLARPRFIFVFLGVFVACQIIFLFLFQALGARGIPTTLDMMTGFTPAQASAHFSLYTDESLAILNWFQAVDVVFPAAYGLLFASFSAWLLGKLLPDSKRILWLGLIPVAGASFDLLENTGIFTMARIYPASVETAATLTSAAGVVKNLLFMGSLLMIVILTVIYTVKKLQAKQTAKNG